MVWVTKVVAQITISVEIPAPHVIGIKRYPVLPERLNQLWIVCQLAADEDIEVNGKSDQVTTVHCLAPAGFKVNFLLLCSAIGFTVGQRKIVLICPLNQQ